MNPAHELVCPFVPPPLEQIDCGPASLFAHQDYTKEVVPECGKFGIWVSTVHLQGVTDLGPIYCIPFAGNMSQYNTVTHLPELPVGRTRQSLPIDSHLQPSPSCQSSAVAVPGHTQYLPKAYETDGRTPVPPQLTTSNPSVFYGQVDQIKDPLSQQRYLPVNGPHRLRPLSYHLPPYYQ